METHPFQNLLPHISPRHINPLSGFPLRPPWKEVPLSRAFFYTCRFHQLSSHKQICSISRALLPLSITVSYKWTPSPGTPMGLYRERPRLQNLLHPIPWKLISPSESPVREPPPCSPSGSLWTEILNHQSHWSIYSCMSARFPRKEPSYKMGKNIRSSSTEPHTDRRPTYSGVQPGSPRGSLLTLLSLPQCHAALGTIPCILAWVDQCPISHRVS